MYNYHQSLKGEQSNFLLKNDTSFTTMAMPQDLPKVSQPTKEHKAIICIWADLTMTHMDTIINCTSMEEIQSFIAESFGLADWHDNYRSAIVLDLFYYTLQFAIDHHFSKEQTSAFFSIVKKTHEVCTETPFDNLEICYNYFKELILCHAVKRPPWSVNIFSPEQVHLVTEYVLTTYFKHYKLYKYAFTPLVKLDLSISYDGVPLTPEPVDVCEETQEFETEAIKESEDVQGECVEVEESAKPATEEENAVERELRQIVTDQLSVEIQKLKLSISDQIQSNDEELQKKLSAIDGKSSQTKVGGRASSKSKKK
ncbi:cilia- and flagella-associated protein 119-like [Antedon mediterranea]|uniref:cilia- and flagella-associated protein 119-like n=1 Tax=Antedon mediterranea TaxID=105859 RepID=UPI003AF8C765